jgi:hypothetical protein
LVPIVFPEITIELVLDRVPPDEASGNTSTFARVFPEADDVRRSAVRHLASVAARAGLEGAPHLYRVDADCGPRGEAAAAAELIANLVRTRPGESIAVLAGARGHLRAIRAALAARAVPFVGVNLEPWAMCRWYATSKPGARAGCPSTRGMAGVLRAPFMGLSLSDLTVIAEAARDSNVPAALSGDIFALSDGMGACWDRAAAGGLAAARTGPRAHMVERVWHALGGRALAHDSELATASRFRWRSTRRTC